VNLVVHPSGFAEWNHRRIRCALGTGGIARKQNEGDGITPVGVFPLRQVFFRSDREDRPDTILSVSALTQSDGWSDDPDDPHYNQQISLPTKNHHEILWRADGVYDLMAVVGYNDRPIIPGAGSAIFLHVAKSGYSPTEGCVAFALPDLSRILNEWEETSVLDIRSKT
jgi:L,D-peptidoglycan transpeptidase YkuD (ErfK/YbiS/YcfS/YnhG family)